MKKTTLKKNERALKYSAMAGAFLASGVVNSQIQYTDVNPDQVVDQNNSPFLLDLDGDANTDVSFNVAFVSGTYYGGLINYSGFYAAASAALGIVMDTASSPAVLSAGDTIDNTVFGTSATGQLAYSINITGLYSGVYQGGNFAGASDAYLGISFDISGSTHYGWVRLDVAPDGSSITIKDHAYNTVASDGMLAGQTVGLDDVAMDQKVSFRIMLDEAVINVTPDLLGSEIAMVDMSGREVSTTTILDVNTTVQYDQLDSGVYMLVVKAQTGSISKKVYVR